MFSILRNVALASVFAIAFFGRAACAGTITYYHNDLLGSPLVATNASGQVIWRESYRPYGERITNAPASADNEIWFTSRRQDAETGLVYMGARYYEPVIGRFLSVDPQLFAESNVHSFNRYAYANGNPYRFIDPDGMEGWEAAKPNFFRDTFVGRIAADVVGKPMALVTANNVNPLTGNMENFSGDKRAEAIIGVLSLGIGLEARTEAATTKEVAQVLRNQIAGNAFRDEIADLLRKAGFEVFTEVPKSTPLGTRIMDIEVRKNGEVLGGLELKTKGSRYRPDQRAKDEWLKRFDDVPYPVNVVRDQ